MTASFFLILVSRLLSFTFYAAHKPKYSSHSLLSCSEHLKQYKKHSPKPFSPLILAIFLILWANAFYPNSLYAPLIPRSLNLLNFPASFIQANTASGSTGPLPL